MTRDARSLDGGGTGGDHHSLVRPETNQTAPGAVASAGFTIVTRSCNHFHIDGCTYPSDLQISVAEALRRMEAVTGCGFGDPRNPLFVSVTADAEHLKADSEPASIDFLGLNDQTVSGLVERCGQPHQAWDRYRRFMESYGSLVLGIDRVLFDERLSLLMEQRGVDHHDDLATVDLQILVGRFRDLIEGKLDRPFSQDPRSQLWGVIGVVFRSWIGARANIGRAARLAGDGWGGSVTVRAMAIPYVARRASMEFTLARDAAYASRERDVEFAHPLSETSCGDALEAKVW